MKTRIKYNLVVDLLGNKANAYDTQSFNSVEEAFKYWEEEYKNRDKKDGYDEYWNKIPFRVQQVIINDFWDMGGQTSVSIDKKEKFNFIKWFK